METPDKKNNSLMWVAGVAIILFCGVGISAIMGWIPTSIGQPSGTVPVTTTEATAPEEAKSAEVKKHPATVTHKARAQTSNPAPTQADAMNAALLNRSVK